jgi:hypothetical protein
VKEKERKTRTSRLLKFPEPTTILDGENVTAKEKNQELVVDKDESKSKLMEITADDLNRAWRERMA